MMPKAVRKQLELIELENNIFDEDGLGYAIGLLHLQCTSIHGSRSISPVRKTAAMTEAALELIKYEELIKSILCPISVIYLRPPQPPALLSQIEQVDELQASTRIGSSRLLPTPTESIGR